MPAAKKKTTRRPVKGAAAPKKKAKRKKAPAASGGKVKRLPARSKVKKADTWDLGSLYPSDAVWDKDFAKLEKKLAGYAKFRGTLAKGAAEIAACFKFDLLCDRLAERLGVYAFLRSAEDSTDATSQRMRGRYMNVASRAGQESSFIRPELLAIPAAKMKKYIAAKSLASHRLSLERLLRYKPHTLSKREENLLAMQSEMAQAAGHIFRQLNDADLRFGIVRDEKGERLELGHGNYIKFMESPNRGVRRRAYERYYGKFAEVDNTIAAALGGSIQKDIYYAKARNHKSALDAALFPDDVPVEVYDNLISTVGDHLPSLHRYFRLRNKQLKLRSYNLYDSYVPLVADQTVKHTWNEAVDVISDSLEPLGSEYIKVLRKGLRGRWSDRYANQGKASGAFSYGTFDGDPYILMNYEPDVLNDVFTLTHEAGHSMHSYYSAGNQPYQYYNYTIFVAEVASTFNEQLLSKHLMKKARTKAQRTMLVNREIDNIRGTIFRQTMFAEFEKITHAMAEAGEPVTLDAFRTVYAELLTKYLGPQLVIDPLASLECLRIPHFYRAFYVYKYATGMSAAIALADRVTEGGRPELADYLGFLKGGCSKLPLELLEGAGVNMREPAPIEKAMLRFGELVEELEGLLG